MQESENYQATEQGLRAVGAQLSAAEAHGLLCGLASAPGETEQAAWIAQVLADTTPRGEEARTLLVELVALYERTMKGLDDEELDFQLLLPEDESPLPDRARALGEWCAGFLAGVGLGGVREAEAGGEVREALRDLGEISRVELEVDEGEENEAAYAELVEFVRVAAMLIRTSIRGAASSSPGPGPEPTLH